MSPFTISMLSLLLLATPTSAALQIEKAVIEGVVVRERTDEPVAGAQVILLRGNTNIEPWAGTARIATGLNRGLPSEVADVATDDKGKFILTGVNPGAYLLAIVAEGYVRQQYGQHLPSLRGTVIHVSSGETRKNLKIPLTPTGTVAGRIFDSSGRAASNVPVELLRVSYNPDGLRQVDRYLATTSDDRGEYRLFGAAPGRYYIFVGTALSANGTNPSRVFSPGVEDIAQALLVEVVAGAERTAPPLTLRPAATYRVRGRLIDAGTGRPPQNTLIQINNLGPQDPRLMISAAPSRIYNLFDGSFEIENVMPGDYVLDISSSGAATAGATVQELNRLVQLAPRVRRFLSVRDRNIENFVLTLTTGQSVEGRVLLDGENITLGQSLTGIRPQLRPSQGGRVVSVQAPRVQPAAADGAFRIEGIQEGEYLVSVVGVPAGFYVKELRHGGDSLLGSPFQFSASSTGTLQILLKQGTSEVRGAVTNKLGEGLEGVTAVLIPSARQRKDLYKTAITDRNGRFTMTEVVPGDYKVFSWEALAPNAHLNLDVVTSSESQGRAIRVAASSRHEVSVTIIPGD